MKRWLVDSGSLSHEISMGLLSRSRFTHLIAVRTLRVCARKKPSFQEKTRFQYALIDIKYFENEPLNKGGGRNL